MTDSGDPPVYTETQERLLRATLETVDEFGVERATTRRIASRAGVNIQLIQYYFGGKEAMLEEVQRYIVARFFEDVGRGDHLILGVSDTTPPAADFERILKVGRRVEAFGAVD